MQISATNLAAPSVPREIHALLLDDSNFDRQRIRRMGTRMPNLPVKLDEVGTLAELEAALGQGVYDVILVDYRLAEGTGVQALERISAMARHSGTGRIMITGDDDIGTAVQAMRNGCHDFLSKDAMSAEVLREAMLNAMALARRNLQLQQQRALQHEALRDGVIAALADVAVRDSLGALIKGQLADQGGQLLGTATDLQSAEIDAFVAGMEAPDEFIFSPAAD